MASRGGDRYLARLRRMHGPALERALGPALFAGGEDIQVEAQISITRGAVSGRGHVPSQPGQPPSNDTGHLANSIETTQPKPLLVKVSSNAGYSDDLEFGTSKMEARPFMRPARDKKRKGVEERVTKAFERFVRSTKNGSA